MFVDDVSFPLAFMRIRYEDGLNPTTLSSLALVQQCFTDLINETVDNDVVEDDFLLWDHRVEWRIHHSKFPPLNAIHGIQLQ